MAKTTKAVKKTISKRNKGKRKGPERKPQPPDVPEVPPKPPKVPDVPKIPPETE
jgi:hypothetical protein